MDFLFKKLDVYKLGYEFNSEVFAITNHSSPKYYAVSDQLRRASLSITANIAEGYGRWHGKEKSQFYRIALGSANECVALLEAASQQQLISISKCTQLTHSLDRIAKMLQNLIRSVQTRRP